MTEISFPVDDAIGYIQLNNLLQLLDFAQTGGHAKLIIQNEEVYVNNEVETRVRKKLVKGDTVLLPELAVITIE